MIMTVHYEFRPATNERISLLIAWGHVVSPFDLKSSFSLYIIRQDNTHLVKKKR